MFGNEGFGAPPVAPLDEFPAFVPMGGSGQVPRARALSPPPQAAGAAGEPINIPTFSPMAPSMAMPPMPQSMVQAAGGVEPDGLGVVPEDAHTLGISLFLTGLGAAVGLAYGGGYGAVSGGLYGGAAANAVRAVRSVASATPEDDREARISATYSVLSIAVASYILYKTHSEKKRHVRG